MITEPISPLFETFLLPIFVEVLLEMLGGVGLRDAMPAIPYRIVNGHIYLHHEMHLKPWHMPGIVKDFALHLNSMKDQEPEQALYRQRVADLSTTPFHDLDGPDLLKRMDALGQAGMLYWVQIMKIVQVIYRQEAAFTRFYNRHVRGSGSPESEVFLRSQKIKSWEAECSIFELAGLARNLGLEKSALTFPEITLPDPDETSPVQEWRRAHAAHLDQFGQLLSSFDPLLPTIADDPRPALAAIQVYLEGKESPYTRQQRMEMERQAAIVKSEKRLSSR